MLESTRGRAGWCLLGKWWHYCEILWDYLFCFSLKTNLKPQQMQTTRTSITNGHEHIKRFQKAIWNLVSAIKLVWITGFSFHTFHIALRGTTISEALCGPRAFISIQFFNELEGSLSSPFCYIFVSLPVTLSLNCCLLKSQPHSSLYDCAFKSIYITWIYKLFTFYW